MYHAGKGLCMRLWSAWVPSPSSTSTTVAVSGSPRPSTRPCVHEAKTLTTLFCESCRVTVLEKTYILKVETLSQKGAGSSRGPETTYLLHPAQIPSRPLLLEMPGNLRESTYCSVIFSGHTCNNTEKGEAEKRRCYGLSSRKVK